MTHDQIKYEGRRRFFRANLLWIVPLGMLAAAALFVGVGFLFTWLWRVTVGELFGFKPVSFWQAWGLILLAQILFKANVQRRIPIGGMRRGRFQHMPDATASGQEV